MSKQQLQHTVDFNNILDNTAMGNQFLAYLQNKFGDQDVARNNLDNNDLLQEFLAKTQFVIWNAKNKLNADINMEVASTLVSMKNGTSFDANNCGNLFDGFMHFLAVNEKNPEVLGSISRTWVEQGRSLEEEENGLTPLNIAVASSNISFCANLNNFGIDITKPDASGFTELHKIIDQIQSGRSDISVLKAWVEAGLATDVLATEAAGIAYAGKSALDVAIGYGMIETTEILGGDVALIHDDSSQVDDADIAMLYARCKLKVTMDSDLNNDIEGNVAKVFLHYLIEKHDDIPVDLFSKILDTQIITNAVDNTGKSCLEVMVEKGYNDYALEMAKHGYGTIELDNETTILNYAILYNNIDLLDAILASDLDVQNMPLPTRGLVAPGQDAMIANTPLLQAINAFNIEALTKLVQHGIGTKFLDNGNHVLSYIYNFGAGHTIDLINAVAPSVSFDGVEELGIDQGGDPITQSSAVAQTLVTALMAKDAAVVKALVDSGANINYNNGEILNLFLGAGIAFADSIKIAILNGAEVIESMQDTIAVGNLNAIINLALAEKAELAVNFPVVAVDLLGNESVDDLELNISLAGEEKDSDHAG